MSDSAAIYKRLEYFARTCGYPVRYYRCVRKVGPPAHIETYPQRGTEIFAHNLPPDAYEDEIFWFFNQVGVIHEIRLVMMESGIVNRGYAFIRFCERQQAVNAVAILNQRNFRPQCKLRIEPSSENNRLFLSGLPRTKCKFEIWNALLSAGFRQITDVIVYKPYIVGTENRGYVFIEFETRMDADIARRKFDKHVTLWGLDLAFDWAQREREVRPDVMARVTRLFLRNLNVEMTKNELMIILNDLMNVNLIEKMYKERDYCFLHFLSRELAEIAFQKLQDYFRGTDVEVCWSKPPPPASRRNRNMPPRFRKVENERRVEQYNTFDPNYFTNDRFYGREQQMKRSLASASSSEGYVAVMLKQAVKIVREWNTFSTNYSSNYYYDDGKQQQIERKPGLASLSYTEDVLHDKLKSLWPKANDENNNIKSNNMFELWVDARKADCAYHYFPVVLWPK